MTISTYLVFCISPEPVHILLFRASRREVVWDDGDGQGDGQDTERELPPPKEVQVLNYNLCKIALAFRRSVQHVKQYIPVKQCPTNKYFYDEESNKNNAMQFNSLHCKHVLH